MIQQDWKGKNLDKDIINPNNKVYSPENCVFVSHQVNNLLIDRGRARGKYKQGVYCNKQNNKFHARCRVDGKHKHLGYFDNELEAYTAYVEFKAAHIREVADTQEPRVRDGLYRHAEALELTLTEQ